MDITALRPWYLSATYTRDFHYAVFNSRGDQVLVLVTDVGGLRSYYVPSPVFRTHSVVYEDKMEVARICLSEYARKCEDLFKVLIQYGNPPGVYGMSVLNAAGKRLYTFELTLT